MTMAHMYNKTSATWSKHVGVRVYNKTHSRALANGRRPGDSMTRAVVYNKTSTPEVLANRGDRSWVRHV